MYTIKNISTKIIHIGTTVLMPDDTMKAPETIANTPALKALAKRHMLEITAPVAAAPKQEAPKQEESGDVEGNAEESGEEQEAPKPKATRRTTRKASEE